MQITAEKKVRRRKEGFRAYYRHNFRGRMSDVRCPKERRPSSHSEKRKWLLVTQFRFPLGGGRQGILFRLDGTLARLFYPSGLSRVEFNVGLKLRRKVPLGVDGVHRAFIHASHAIDAFLRVNNQLTLQLIKAGHGAHHHAVGELAPHTFIGNDMRHKSVLFQFLGFTGAGSMMRREFANTFFGKCNK